MRLLLAACLAILPMVANCAAGQEPTREQAIAQLSKDDAGTRRAAIERLGEVGAMADAPLLVKALRDPDEDARQDAEQALWKIWSRSGNREIDELYATGIEQMQNGELSQAIATFSRIIERKPDFAEAWNKRATAYFLAGDLHKSLADCDEVMKRNPYHFGALSGYVQIFTRLQFYERALDYSRRALAINPNLEGIRQNMWLLEHLIEQRHKQMV